MLSSVCGLVTYSRIGSGQLAVRSVSSLVSGSGVGVCSQVSQGMNCKDCASVHTTPVEKLS